MRIIFPLLQYSPSEASNHCVLFPPPPPLLSHFTPPSTSPLCPSPFSLILLPLAMKPLIVSCPPPPLPSLMFYCPPPCLRYVAELDKAGEYGSIECRPTTGFNVGPKNVTLFLEDRGASAVDETYNLISFDNQGQPYLYVMHAGIYTLH